MKIIKKIYFIIIIIFVVIIIIAYKVTRHEIINLLKYM